MEKENALATVAAAAPAAAAAGGTEKALDLGSVRKALEEIEANSSAPSTSVERDEHGFTRNAAGAWTLDGGFVLPDRVYKRLYEHQRAGVAWAWGLVKKGAGGILADDMGMGKTMQTAALLRGIFESAVGTKRVLVLCPKSLLAHWDHELRTWLGTRVCTFAGAPAARNGALESVCHRGGVLLASYGMVTTCALHLAKGPAAGAARGGRRAWADSDEEAEAPAPRRKGPQRRAKAAPKAAGALAGDDEEEEEEEDEDGAGSREAVEAELQKKPDVEWDAIVCDEGHRLKNPAMKLCQRIRLIRARARLVLTGTPVQNRLRELWALLDWACAGALLGDAAAFRRTFEGPISRASERDAGRGEIRLGRERAEALRALIAPHFLRREKAAVFGGGDPAAGGREEAGEAPAAPAAKEPTLPRKNDFIVWTRLAATQARVYRAFLDAPVVREALNRTASPLAALTVLKKICDHPRLLLPDGAGEDPEAPASEQRACIEGVLEALAFDRACAPGSEAAAAQSGKLAFLLQLLAELRAGGHRALVFSQSRRALDIIEAHLARQGVEFLRVDGTVTDGRERQRRVDAFNKCAKYSAFLLTTQTGGLGFTLTGADRVVIFDPSWNPSVDNQAVDRVYRIGQRRPVVVYRLLTCGTIEERIYRRQVFKGALSLTAAEGGGKAARAKQQRYFTSDELRELFTLEEGAARTMQQLNAEHAAQRRTDAALDAHLARLRDMGMEGVSDHDLLFSKDDREEIPIPTRPAPPAARPFPAAPPPQPRPAAPQPPAGRIGRDLSYEEMLASPSKRGGPAPAGPAPLPRVPLRPPAPAPGVAPSAVAVWAAAAAAAPGGPTPGAVLYKPPPFACVPPPPPRPAAPAAASSGPPLGAVPYRPPAGFGLAPAPAPAPRPPAPAAAPDAAGALAAAFASLSTK